MSFEALEQCDEMFLGRLRSFERSSALDDSFKRDSGMRDNWKDNNKRNTVNVRNPNVQNREFSNRIQFKFVSKFYKRNAQLFAYMLCSSFRCSFYNVTYVTVL